MRIIVDADSCPVKEIIEEVAREYMVPVVMVSNLNHNITSNYSEIVVVDGNSQAADLAIINMTNGKDIIVTQDYGLASMVLGKKAQAISPSGNIYSLKNIDTLLMQRHINFKARQAGLKIPNSKKRSKTDDNKFRTNLIKLIEKNL
ncbi:MAG: YaiI/YqxD family protein [Syntrophomonadaceae bacterium]|nr:YaiI/YqxD family protein [Syntrophomonadaceae bacterium]